jgi:hypothetical protein
MSLPILTGSDYSRPIRFTSGSAPLDLTGCGLEMVIKAKLRAPAPLLTLTMGAGLAVPSPADGIAILTLTGAQTTQIGVGERVWAIYRCGSGQRICLATGKMTVRRGL